MSPEEEAALDATIHRIAESHGFVSNLMQTLALAPAGLAAFASLSSYARYGNSLTPLQREIAILAAVRDVHYGWSHHEPLARAAGLSREQLLLIRDGRVPKDLPEAEAALCGYAFEIATGRRIPPRVAEAVRANFGPRQIVDIALLVVFAMAEAALALGLEVPLEEPDVLAFEEQWHSHAVTGHQPADLP